MERSFAEEVKQLALGDGQVLRGEGILAITKALLQSGVSYVGGYPGAPVSHLLDVLADANESLLKPMGVYLDASANEAAAAALLGASINYPMRGAVTWKSIVGTNVAADALSNLASAGVIGGALIVVGEDYGAGASVIQERTHSFALKSSLPLIDPRPTLQNLARMVEEGFGLSEASNLPTVISLRIRAAHMRGSLVCRDNVRPAISHEHAARAALLRLRPPEPPAVHLHPGGAEVRAAAARGPALHRRARPQRGDPRRGEGARHHPPGRPHPDRAAGARAPGHGRPVRRLPHPAAGAERDPPARARAARLLPRGQAARARARRRHAELHRAGAEGAGLRARAHHAHPRQGRGGRAGRVRARGGAGRPRALPGRRRGAAAAGAHRARGAGPRAAAGAAAQAPARVLHRLPGAAGVQRAQDRPARARRDPRGGRHRLPRLRDAAAVQPGQHHPGLRDERGLRERGGAPLRQARDLDPGRRRLLALGPHRGRGQRGLQQAGLDRGGAGELLHLGHRPAGQSLVGQEPARRHGEDVHRRHHPEPRACRGSRP